MSTYIVTLTCGPASSNFSLRMTVTETASSWWFWIFVCTIAGLTWYAGKEAGLSDEEVRVPIGVAVILSFVPYSTILSVLGQLLKFVFRMAILLAIAGFIWYGVDPKGCRSTILSYPELRKPLLSTGVVQLDMWEKIQYKIEDMKDTGRQMATDLREVGSSWWQGIEDMWDKNERDRARRRADAQIARARREADAQIANAKRDAKLLAGRLQGYWDAATA